MVDRMTNSSYFPSVLRQSSDLPVWVSANGAYVSTKDGERFLDCTSGFGVTLFGHAHPKIVDAVCNQIRKLPHAISSVYPHVYEDSALSKIARHAPIANPSIVLTSSGSEAVEVALKAAFLFTGKAGVGFLEGAYHGQSIGALRVNGLSGLRVPLTQLIQGNDFLIPFPKDNLRRTEPLEALSDILKTPAGKKSLGAVIVEPMQNPAGYRMLSSEFCVELTELCRDNDLLLISDEIFTGFGRSGHWNLSEKLGLKPDIYCYGKAMTGGIPAGACVGSRNIISTLATDSGIPLHSPTFLGSPIICAAVAASISILEEENIPERSRVQGAHIRSRIDSELTDSPIVTDVRGAGCAIAIQFSDFNGDGIGRRSAIRSAKKLREYGILAINSGFPSGDVLALTPSATLKDVEVEEIVEAVLEIHSELSNEFRGS